MLDNNETERLSESVTLYDLYVELFKVNCNLYLNGDSVVIVESGDVHTELLHNMGARSR